MKLVVRRRSAAAVAAVATASFAAGAWVADHDPAATGTAAFMREVAHRMDLTPAELRATVALPPGPRRRILVIADELQAAGATLGGAVFPHQHG